MGEFDRALERRPDLQKRKKALESKLRKMSNPEVKALAGKIQRARKAGQITQKEYSFMRGVVEKEVERRRRKGNDE
jgi:hypothetical protein